MAKTFNKKRLVCLSVALVVLVAAMSVSALAYSKSYPWSIPSGTSSWSGKGDSQWNFTTTSQATYTTSVSSTISTTVTSKLMKLVVLFPDTQILSYTVSAGGSNYGSFIPSTGSDNSYYAALSTSNTAGANGTVSVSN